ncbi:MAG TPA: DUF5058 domain-containing protein [Spirochaeta sp.]|nr:DUF5058 domain-containing protein [Spirochaeta sp.]
MNTETAAVANSGLMLLLCTIPIVIVTIQAIIFLVRAYREAGNMGISVETRKKVILNSAVFSIVPSLPIIIIMAVLMPALGKYLPWLRLSVIGSAFYENMAADMAVKAFGLSGIADTGLTPSIFVSVTWVMTLGVLMYPLANIFFLKRYDRGIKQMQSKGGFMVKAIPAMFLGLMAAYVGPYIANYKNYMTIVAVAASGILVFSLSAIAKKSGQSWLNEFSFPLSLVGGMAAAIILTPILT